MDKVKIKDHVRNDCTTTTLVQSCIHAAWILAYIQTSVLRSQMQLQCQVPLRQRLISGVQHFTTKPQYFIMSCSLKLWLPSYFNFIETRGKISIVNTAVISRQLRCTERLFSRIEIQVTSQQFALTFQQHTPAFQLKGMKYESLRYVHD